MDGDLISRKALLEKLDECDALERKLTANVYDKDEMMKTLDEIQKLLEIAENGCRTCEKEEDVELTKRLLKRKRTLKLKSTDGITR